jgi:hypothetical protein
VDVGDTYVLDDAQIDDAQMDDMDIRQPDNEVPNDLNLDDMIHNQSDLSELDQIDATLTQSDQRIDQGTRDRPLYDPSVFESPRPPSPGCTHMLNPSNYSYFPSNIMLFLFFILIRILFYLDSSKTLSIKKKRLKL